MKLLQAGIALGFVTIATAPVRAQLLQIADPTGLNPADVTTPDYPGNFGDNVAAPFSLTAGGDLVTFTTLNGSTVQRQDSTGLDFPVGTSLITTLDSPPQPDGPLRLDFAAGIREFGLSAESTGFDFETFTFSAYNNAVLLGTFTTPLTDNTSATGTALFLGAKVSGSDVITSVIVSSTSDQAGTSDSFFVSPVTFRAAPAATPEPGAYALLAALGAAVVSLRHRRVR